MKLNWWKILAVLLLLYTIIAGLLLPVPKLPILHESIRNTYFHIPMWFTMIFILGASVVNGVRYLGTNDEKYDIAASQMAVVGVLFGFLGLFTGMLWAYVTWGDWWVSSDPKLNGAAATMLIYLAYLVLRGSMEDREKRARISAVFSIFAYFLLLVFLLVLPRLKGKDSLHPGSGGNPGFGGYDLDGMMRLVFYPAVVGWILLAWWISNIRIRVRKIELNLLNENS
jgi:heme exporter protein C